MKRIVICADGTWGRPEEDLERDYPTNVLRLARAIAPRGTDGVEQVVFYDWGLGSYHDRVSAGAFGAGINKNIQDGYRFIVQNYDLGDELFFFGYSRGAFTVRSLSGLMNNCGILKRADARLVARAFDIYKSNDIHPDDDFSHNWRRRYSVHVDPSGLSRDEQRAWTHDGHPKVTFVGVWDTVGSLGIPLSVLGFLNREHMFHDTKIGPNIEIARHALAIDERRDDFRPTIWNQRPGVDIAQVWFAGCHGDVGGGLAPDDDGSRLADIPLQWIGEEAAAAGLTLAPHLGERLRPRATARLNETYQGKWKLAGKHERTILHYLDIHPSVKQRWDDDPSYRPKKLVERVEQHGWGDLVGAPGQA